MKRKPLTETKTFPSVILYQEDLNELLGIFKGNTSGFEISDKEFEYDTLEEVKAKRGPIVKRLSIESDAPMLSLKFEDGKTELRHDGNIMSAPGFNEVSKLLNATRRRAFFAVFNLYVAIGSIVLVAALAAGFGPPWKGVVAIPVTLALFAFVIISLMNHSGGFSRLVFTSRHEDKSFLARNKDTIWVGIIVAIVTAFVTWLITYFTTK